ncbi:hypothetical protein DL240_10705 [Lujinxingia litoralis]|uniref:Uncharacterized protein n=1 Tax=Lujinxingia litoralis TaxID=2211119 RepID=A0A328C9L1_9DELT|nr:hypothetical protein [Lujinxingia litoralis]RAL22313.1 hypothetical protein DL240_10705 [Lujinxingia litoralis]
MSCLERVLASVWLIVAMLLISGSVVAEEPWMLEAQLDPSARLPGIEALEARGASVGRVLVVERTAPGRYLAEAEVLFGDHALRLPLIMERALADGELRVVWAPQPAYVEALLTFATGDALPSEVAPVAWVEERRLPALPLIATRARIVSPYGEVAWQSPELGGHLQRWLREALNEAGGPAGVDLLVERRLGWERVAELMMAVASAGLFRVHIITSSENALGAIDTNLPIFPGSGLPPKMVMGLLGIYRNDQGFGIRLRLDEQNVAGSADGACPPEQTFCARDRVEFEQALGQVLASAGVEGARITHWMIGGTAEFSAGEAVRALVWTYETLGISPRATFIGYIE